MPSRYLSAIFQCADTLDLHRIYCTTTAGSAELNCFCWQCRQVQLPSLQHPAESDQPVEGAQAGIDENLRVKEEQAQGCATGKTQLQAQAGPIRPAPSLAMAPASASCFVYGYNF